MNINDIDKGLIKNELLKLKQDELTVSKLSSLFGKTTVKEKGKFTVTQPKYDLRMEMHLDANEYINKEAVDTTVGIFLFNKLMVEGVIESIIPGGYYNYVIDKKSFGNLMSMISQALMDNKLSINPNLVKFLKHYEFYGMKACTIFSPSYTRRLLETSDKLAARKEELLNSTEIKSVQDMTKIEDTLVAEAKSELKGDPGMTLFDSGARGSFENDYKNMNLMLGPVGIPGDEGKFEFVKSNYIHGLQKEDFVAAGNTIVNAAYPKAVGTEKAGYLTKQFYAVYQSIVVDEDGTDCGTHKGLEMFLTEDMASMFLYQNIEMPSGKIVNLCPDNMSQFIGKKVKMRSPMFCTSDKCCSVCAGTRPYIMNIKNIGLTSGRISNTLLNKSMKAFHNSKVSLDVVDINKLLL